MFTQDQHSGLVYKQMYGGKNNVPQLLIESGYLNVTTLKRKTSFILTVHTLIYSLIEIGGGDCVVEILVYCLIYM